jgi:CheY-like chemotaxis protein
VRRDDSPDGREVLVESFTFRGFTVIAAANGEEALTQARHRCPAVILMDLQMPGIGGWEATRQRKADSTTKEIIVIAVTAHAPTPDEAIARQARGDGLISKPYDLIVVANAIGQVLRRGRRGLIALDRLKPRKGVTGKRDTTSAK